MMFGREHALDRSINDNASSFTILSITGKSCRRCGLERQSSKSKVESWWRDWSQSIRRSQSEESVSTLNNPYEAMRKQRLNSSQQQQQNAHTPSTANNNGGRYISGWNNESSGESQNNSEDEERSRAYAEVDLIYNSVRRRALPAMPTLGVNHYEPQQPQRLQRSSSNVIRRSVILKTPVQHSKMLPKTPNSTTKIYVSNPPMTASAAAAPSNGIKPHQVSKSALNEDAEDSSAKESLSEEDDDSDTEDPEKLQKLQIRNLKRLREKVKEEEEKLRALKNTAAKIKDASASGSSGSENNLLQKLNENDYDGDISAADLESPQKVNKVHLLQAKSPTSTSVDSASTESKLMQLYHRRKRQQEQQLRSEFNVKHLDMKELTVKDNIASHPGNNCQLVNVAKRGIHATNGMNGLEFLPKQEVSLNSKK